MELQIEKKRRKRIKLIFNPLSGKNKESPTQLMEVIKELQDWKLIAEPFLIEPNCDLKKVVTDSIEQGIHMFVVCGGDGTVSSVAKAMVGTNATLGIIPTGTRNNVAKSIGIPLNIPAAIAMLRMGRRIKIDLGICRCDNVETPFIEICSVGLFSKLFSASDDIQHGKIMRIGDFLADFITTPPSDIHLILDNNEEIQNSGHVVLITNTPFVGANKKVSDLNSYRDGLLDVLFYTDLSKINLIGNVLKESPANDQDDPHIRCFRVRSVSIHTNPAMPVMADSIAIGEGSVRVGVLKSALTVIVPPFTARSGDIVEQENK